MVAGPTKLQEQEVELQTGSFLTDFETIFNLFAFSAWPRGSCFGNLLLRGAGLAPWCLSCCSAPSSSHIFRFFWYFHSGMTHSSGKCHVFFRVIKFVNGYFTINLPLNKQNKLPWLSQAAFGTRAFCVFTFFFECLQSQNLRFLGFFFHQKS